MVKIGTKPILININKETYDWFMSSTAVCLKSTANGFLFFFFKS